MSTDEEHDAEMMRKGFGRAACAFVYAALAGGCGGGHGTVSQASPLLGAGARASAGPVAEYAVRFDRPAGQLRVEARVVPGIRALSVDVGAEAWVVDARCTPDGEAHATWRSLPRRGRIFDASACASSAYRLDYRYLLREAARRLDDLDVASEEGEVLEAPPSTFLLAPAEAQAGAFVRFRVDCPAGTTFETGVFPREHFGARPTGGTGKTGGSPGERVGLRTWDLAVDDLWTSPYSAFGPLVVRDVAVAGATVRLARAPGALAVSDDDLAAWVEASAKVVAGYVGRFPMPSALVLVVPARGAWIGEGRTLAGGGGSIFVRLGERVTAEALRDDWVLVHEMVHLALPSVPREQHWAEEGLATYVEPFARVRAGLLPATEAWRGLLEGLPNGLPRPGDRGLDRTPTWGRTYWGGALFFLLADIGIREATGGRLGLEHALRGIVAAGGNNAKRWSLDEVLAQGDRATGTAVLRTLRARMGEAPAPVDLAALEASLGVKLTDGDVRFDPHAPQAAVRAAITEGQR